MRLFVIFLLSCALLFSSSCDGEKDSEKTTAREKCDARRQKLETHFTTSKHRTLSASVIHTDVALVEVARAPRTLPEVVMLEISPEGVSYEGRRFASLRAAVMEADYARRQYVMLEDGGEAPLLDIGLLIDASTPVSTLMELQSTLFQMKRTQVQLFFKSSSAPAISPWMPAETEALRARLDAVTRAEQQSLLAEGLRDAAAQCEAFMDLMQVIRSAPPDQRQALTYLRFPDVYARCGCDAKLDAFVVTLDAMVIGVDFSTHIPLRLDPHGHEIKAPSADATFEAIAPALLEQAGERVWIEG